jgi:hypothetical protein
MRFGSPYSLLLAALVGQSLLASAFAAPADAAPAPHAHVDTTESPAQAADDLPEVLELTGGDFIEKIAKGTW